MSGRTPPPYCTLLSGVAKDGPHGEALPVPYYQERYIKSPIPMSFASLEILDHRDGSARNRRTGRDWIPPARRCAVRRSATQNGSREKPSDRRITNRESSKRQCNCPLQVWLWWKSQVRPSRTRPATALLGRVTENGSRESLQSPYRRERISWISPKICFVGLDIVRGRNGSGRNRGTGWFRPHPGHGRRLPFHCPYLSENRLSTIRQDGYRRQKGYDVFVAESVTTGR